MRRGMWLIALAGLIGVGVPARAQTVIRPESCPTGAGQFCAGLSCSGTDTQDDTLCWQWALNTAKTPQCGAVSNCGAHDFGKVVGTSGATYIITSKLLLEDTYGGVIDGQGAILLWDGASTSDPMWLLRDVAFLKIQDMTVNVKVGRRLNAGFEFTNADNSTESPAQSGGISPTQDSLDHVTVSGLGQANALDYGVRFSTRTHNGQASIDGNNDQSVIQNCMFSQVMKAAIYIEHSQSMHHRFYNVTAVAACNEHDANSPEACGSDAENPSSFVHTLNGSFMSIGGFRGGFNHSEFRLDGYNGEILIMYSNSEGCARFISSEGWAGGAWTPVRVINARFAAEWATVTGDYAYVINMDGRRGPLVVEGAEISWAPAKAVIHFNPANVTDGPASLTVIGCHFRDDSPNSNTWDPILTNSDANVTAYGNRCQSSNGDAPCIGYGGGIYHTFAHSLSELGTMAPNNGNWAYCSDCKAGTSPCAGSGTGALAVRLNGAWDCGGPHTAAGINALTTDDDFATLTGSQTLTNKNLTSSSNSFPSTLTSDTEWDTASEINAATTDDDLATLTGTQTLSNKNLTASTNTFPATGLIPFGGITKSSTVYCLPGTEYCVTSSESDGTLDVPALRPKTLSCKSSNAAGSGKSWTITVRANSTSYNSCSISGSSSTSCTNTSSASPWADNADVTLKVEPSGGPASASVFCTLGVAP
jgi:hypothetical protein